MESLKSVLAVSSGADWGCDFNLLEERPEKSCR